MFYGPLTASILGRASQRGLIETDMVNLRDFAVDERGSVDDAPYGGGPGMVLMAHPLFSAIDSIKSGYTHDFVPPVVLMTPQGQPFTHDVAIEFSSLPALTLVCGHYEGVDERFVEHAVDREISLGDFVLTGGELAAMVVIDAVSRLLPGVLGDDSSSSQDSFSAGIGGMLEGPVYTRPAEYRGWRVPDELLTGDHDSVERFRRRTSVERTADRRPDLLEGWGPPESNQ